MDTPRSPRRAAHLGVALAAGWMALTSNAAAQTDFFSFRWSTGGTQEAFFCEQIASCQSETECRNKSTSLTCANLTSSTSYCVDSKREILCCDPQNAAATCGTNGSCWSAEIDRTTLLSVCISDSFRLCARPAEIDAQTIDLDRVLTTCVKKPDGSNATRWVEGDCDGDDVPNGFDCRPCDAQNTKTRPNCDPVTHKDAGSDGGGADAGSTTFRGRGGISCSAASSPAFGGPAMVLAVALLVSRRRRRAQVPPL